MAAAFAPALTTISIELADGETVEAEVKRSSRARVTRIQIGPDGPPRIVVPAGASDEYAREALISKANWVRAKLEEVALLQSKPDTLGLERPGVAWYAGRPLTLRPSSTRFARRRGDILEVPEQREDGDRAIGRWYRREAKSHLQHLVDDEQARLGYGPTRLRVRDQRTRWGSCSSAGEISLNWRLMLVPEGIARYVVVHELIHLRVPNHSRTFWRALSAACPGWQQSAAWLREHGDEVRRFRAR